MAKLNEMIYDIREYIREFSDDTEVDDRHLVYLINIKRAKYLRQDLNNYQKATDLSIQQKFCVAMEEVSADECGQDIYCDKVLRSVKPLPKAIELHTRTAITKLKPTNVLSVPFNVISKDKVPYLKDSPFKNSIYAFIDSDNYVYLISSNTTYKLIDCLNVAGIFENPLELSEFTNCCGCPESEQTVCYDQNESEYPLQPHYVDLIKREIVNDLMKVKQMPEDKINDTND